MIKQFTREGVTFWSGTKAKFDRLKEGGELVKDRIYFVGDSDADVEGFGNSKNGDIFVAVSSSRVVRFGDWENAKEVMKEYRTASSFPTTGREGRLYIASDTGLMYRWNGSAYVVMGGYTDGYGIDITGAGEIKTEPITDAEIDAMNAGERNGHLLDNLGLVRLWNRIVSFFVQKEDGKGLSSNDYTDSEKGKLAGIEQGAEVNVQSDWNQTDTSADDYIKNKPSVYTKTEIDNMLAAGMHYEVVSSLPSTGEAGTLYLVPSSTSATGDVYDEYIWIPTEGQVSAHFEKIGTTKADLANYYTKSEVDTALGNKQANISITTNTSTPTDNDTVIMQASGTTGTTSFIRRTMSKIWDYIKSKADLIYSTITETNKKTNRIIDHTWNQPSYSASESGTHVKICDIPADCVCVMNVRKSVYGYPSINTIWIGNNNSLDFKSLTETDIVATVSSRICTLSVPAHTSSGTPLHTYDFEISVLNKENLSAITWYDDATYYSPSRLTKPNIVMQQSAPVTDGSLAFNVNSSTHVASVSVDGYTDFVGMLTEDSESAVLVKLSDEEEGSVYRFTFDHAIEGGVSFSNSNASTVYCEVSQDIHAGDTITLTAVSNTSDGWIASVSSAGIISSDNSVGIEWENGVADLKVEGIPFNNLVNNAMFQEGDSPYPLAVGSGAVSLLKSGDEDYPFILTKSAKLVAFKVDDSTTNVYSYFVNGGTTYSLNVSGTIISYTPSTNKYIYIIYPSTMYASEKIVAGQYWYIDGTRYTTNEVVKSGSYYVVGSQNIPGGMNSSTIVNATIYKNGIASNGYPQALGLNCEAKGEASTAVGIQAKSLGGWSVAIGNNAYALGYDAIAIGNTAKAYGDYSIYIGCQASTIGRCALSIGYYARVKGLYSVALGSNSKAYSERSVAIGNYSATALEEAIAVGDNAYAGYDSNDADYPKYLVKRFTAIDFTENGVTKKVRWVGSNDEVTIVLNGNTITLSAPNNNSKFFIIVNDSLAVRIGKPITSHAKINGVETYCNIGGYNVTPVAVNGNVYYALWMYSTQSYFQNTIDSFSFLAYYKATYSQGYMFAFGYNAVATNTNAIAFGNETRAIRDRQIVIGSGNLPDENALFIIGGGSQTANSRKNILTIDDKEIVHARAYVSDAVTYELNGASVSLGTITMGLLKVTGGGTLTLTSTNAVEGHCVKVYASGSDITCNGDSITAGRWREYLFIDGAWRSKM